MTHTKILFGQIAISFLLVLLAMWSATQWAAAQLGYQLSLGVAWFSWNETSIYKPWRIFQWWYAFEAYAPDVFAKAGLISVSGGFLAICAAIAGSVLRARHQKHVTTYGSARWAEAKDVKQAKLLRNSGVCLGKWQNQYLRHDGPEHVMAFAPTRSGKGVGLVIPTLLTWTSSAVIHDIKGENWSLTSKWRSKFSKCLRFDPTDPSSVKFNPLLEVRRGDHEVRDVQNIADILVDPEGSLERRNHWERTAHALLTGVLLHVLYVQTDKTLSGAAKFLSDPSRSIGDTLQLMLKTNHIGSITTPTVHPVIAQSARELLNKSENERSGVVSTAISCLTLYRDPVLSKVTAASDFRISDLITYKTPLSLYLVVPPSDISRTKPLIRLILNQIARRLTQQLPAAKDKQRQLLLMLDEFPALGRLEFFETSLAFFAGYGIRAFLIAQSLNQIDKAYGAMNSILDNCHIKIAFATNDDRTAKRISESLGTATQQRAQRNYTGHRLAPWLSHVMVSRQETSRPLLTPGEIMQLPPDDELLMIASLPPIKAKKLRYFEDKNFVDRVGDIEISSQNSISDQTSEWLNEPVKPLLSSSDILTSYSDTSEAGGLALELALDETASSEHTDQTNDNLGLTEDHDAQDMDTRSLQDIVRKAHGLDKEDDDLLPEY
ncbi:IncP-type conjugal transfer protein TraG [Hirschia baltica]|uniref:TRAG family protein n=1 Tax=Hirschia baltica (strain ATCC 49814 / DSM 5838 / IFAM 1418) TaxID=582402 RepID=C6XP86_HIRBI|nr:IncP-type conjugal transfer protein TraG [Hirschia baltica]ACT58372.1 TRAG family protein [Hirschia baltica ATCC 49814]